jgi:outer membrane protein assembly factor BamA
MKTTCLRILLAGAVLAVFSAGLAAQETGDGSIPERSYKSFSPMPIVMYDGDIGVGYGGKIKFVDYLGKKESFDLILFNSSKGERWYVFTFSVPDLEIRQNKKYGLSFDAKLEYDKYLKYFYYGLGPDSKKDDKTEFTHETKSIQLTLGHGFSPVFALEVSYVLRWLNYEHFQPGPFESQLQQYGGSTHWVPYASAALRYDTSNSQIHPTRGVRLLLQDDLASGNDAKYNRITAEVRKYWAVFGDVDVFAARIMVQYIDGAKIPLFDYSSLGGGDPLKAMRAFSLNRFLGNGKILSNFEYRFPLVWNADLPLGIKLGGNLFVDAGTVWNAGQSVDLGKMAVDAGAGLRIYLPDFVVRVDVGFGKEGMGLYFNFGHIF